MWVKPRVKNSSHVSVQELSCGALPLNVVTEKPNLPFGDLLFMCNSATFEAKPLTSGSSSAISWKVARKKWQSGYEANVPQPIGRGVKSGNMLQMALIDVNSPSIIFRPRSP